MKRFLIYLVLVLIIFSIYSSKSIWCSLPGDVDGDGDVDGPDLMVLEAYLRGTNEDVPNRDNADVDNSPGITIADWMQLYHYLYYTGECAPNCLWDAVGTDIITHSNISLTALPFISGSVSQKITVPLKLNNLDDSALVGLIIPLSFKSNSGETEVICDTVDFSGTYLDSLCSSPTGHNQCYFKIDNEDKKVLLILRKCEAGRQIIIPENKSVVIANLVFEVTSSGTPLGLSATFSHNCHTPLLISKRFYISEDDSPGRLLYPKLFLNMHDNGDVNCDGDISVSDIIYINNYLFKGGPPPCNR